MKIKNIKLITFFLILCLILSGCNKEVANQDPTEPGNATGTTQTSKPGTESPAEGTGTVNSEEPSESDSGEPGDGDNTTEPGATPRPETSKPGTSSKTQTKTAAKTTAKAATATKTAVATKTQAPVKTTAAPPYRTPNPSEISQNKKNYYAGYTQVNSVSSGISWPADQALPIFSTPAETLDSIASSALTSDERIAFSSLQGLVNKTQTRILITESGRTWNSTLGFKTNSYKSSTKYDLVKKYKSTIKGIVLYDTSKSVHYRNLASTIANIKGYIPVTNAVKNKLSEAGITFTSSNTVNITGLSYTTDNQIYDYLYKNYWKDCTKRLLVSANPDSDLDHNRDIAAAVGAAVVYCATLTDTGKAQYEKFMKDMADNGDTSIVLGWFPSERSGITAATKYGIGSLPADHYISGSVFSGTSHIINIPKVPKRGAAENKAYIAVYLSDGDNIQYCQGAMKEFWDREKSNRGKVAVNWTIAPGLADIGPGIMNYYYGQASDKECFVAGPSGMGYIMPYNTLRETGAPIGDYLTDKKYADKYTKLTETYLQKSGIRVVTIWDGASDMVRKSYEENCRNLYGVTVQNFSGRSVTASTVNKRVRFDLLRQAYNGDYNNIYGSISTDLKNWDGKSTAFLSYQLDRWHLGTADVVRLESDLKKAFPNKNFEFVRADHYFSYYNELNGLPFNLTMLSATKVSSSDSAGKPENVTDGSNKTMWTTSKTGGKYLQFDFGRNYSISRYVIRHAETTGMVKNYNTRAWKVEVSTDNKSWTTVDTYKSNVKAVTDIEISAVTARYVRITVLDSGDPSAARIADVEIYGTKIG